MTNNNLNFVYDGIMIKKIVRGNVKDTSVMRNSITLMKIFPATFTYMLNERLTLRKSEWIKKNFNI